MAKVSRVNVAITGDARGLATATDQATRDLRRLEIAAERTKQRLNSMRGTTNQTAESLGKLGVQSRALGAAGVGAMAAGAVISGIQDAPNQRMRALDALRRSRSEGVDITTLGFSQPVAQAIASGRQRASVAEQIGVMEAFSQGLATGGGTSTGEFLINQLPKQLATFFGSRLAGKSEEESMSLAGSIAEGSTEQREYLGAAVDIMNWGGFNPYRIAFSELAAWWSK
jgi:hypothetical protein